MLTELLARYSGKKILSLALGLATVLYLVQQAWGVVDGPEHRTWITCAALLSVGLCVAGFTVGQGIGDSGERRPVAKE